MNDNESILAELRRIGAWADMQRKITKWSFIVMAIILPAMIVFGIVIVKREAASLEDTSSPQKPETPAWSDVDWKMRHAELDEAIRIGEELIEKSPQYLEGHQRLASAYLAAGKIEWARQHYEQAFHLFPSEENERLLIAIDKRIKEVNPQPDGATNRSQPVRPGTNQTSTAAGSGR
jgi:tetratricopeptide (TPR) repeat protein